MARTKSSKTQTSRVANDLAGHNQPTQQVTSFDHDMENLGVDFQNFDEEMNFSLDAGMFDANYSGQQPVSAPYSIDPMAFQDPSSLDLSSIGSGTVGHPGMLGNWSGLGEPLTTQNEIVNNRSTVSQHFGQVTPPDDHDTPDLKDQPSSKGTEQSQEDVAKINRAQRARNAANKRHSKKRKDSPLDGANAGEVDEDDQSAGTTVQREKNRIAAAKCRAKKKANAEEMQDIHRDGARMNAYLQREVRELRDQKAFLRNALLCHEPGTCQCHSIHRFNMAQAQQMAMGVGNIMPPDMISPRASVSANTPDSEMSFSARFSVASNAQSRQQSFSQGFPQSMAANQMLDPSQAPQFGDFLNNSPGGQGGFS